MRWTLVSCTVLAGCVDEVASSSIFGNPARSSFHIWRLMVWHRLLCCLARFITFLYSLRAFILSSLVRPCFTLSWGTFIFWAAVKCCFARWRRSFRARFFFFLAAAKAISFDSYLYFLLFVGSFSEIPPSPPRRSWRLGWSDRALS